MNFEWHPPKAERNLASHGISFDEAKTVFDDDRQMHQREDLHSLNEQRYISG